MRYLNIDDFAKSINKSKKTVYRFYKEHDVLWDETKLKKRRLIPDLHRQYWNLTSLIDNNYELREENIRMKKLIKYLYKKEKPLAEKLWRMEWSAFVGINYRYPRNQEYCFKKMNELYEALLNRFGDNNDIRLFFVTEKCKTRENSYHNHFTFYTKNERLLPLINIEIKRFFEYERVHIKNYTKFYGGLFYIMKEDMNGIGWDILGNNLKHD